MYSKILFKDKKDIDDEFRGMFNEPMVIGAMEKQTEEMLNAEILSVKFSKVGAGTFKKMPNLKWIVNRCHGVDNINLRDCAKHNVGVVTASPHSREVAEYITYHFAENHMQFPICYYGFGSIAKETAKILRGEYTYVNTKEDCRNIRAKDCKTVIFTLPPSDEQYKGFIGNYLINSFHDPVDIISVSRAELHNNNDLLVLKKSGRIRHLVVDTIGTEERDSLTNEGMVYTKHTAWEYNFCNHRYLQRVKEVVDSVVNGNPINVVLNRRTYESIID